MVAKQKEPEVSMPPFYEIRHYALNEKLRIEQWTYVPYGTSNKIKTLHGDIEKRMFLGYAIVSKGKKEMKIRFPLPASSVHHAVAMFHDCMNAFLAEMNKPNLKIIHP